MKLEQHSLIIAADIGGTKADFRLAWAENTNECWQADLRLDSTAFTSLDSLLHRVCQLANIQPLHVRTWYLAIPAPVDKELIQVTNLPWVIDKQKLAQQFGDVYYLNDFQAMALGVLAVSQTWINLTDMQPKWGETAVVAGAGTGLGVSPLVFQNNAYFPQASEGGHWDFAPTTEEQVKLWRLLHQDYGHVSYERILSGTGIEVIYRLFEPHHQYSAAEISRRSLHQDPLAEKSLRLFVEIYGQYLGNLALLFKPQGGIFIAGGVAAKNIRWMMDGCFYRGLYAKGRFESLVRQTPIVLVTHEHAGLIGALESAKNPHLFKKMSFSKV